MAVSHVKSITVADGTNTNIVRPGDWNSVHNQYWTLAGNTAGASTLSGSNIVLQGGNNITLSGTDQTIILSGYAGAGVGETVGTIAGTDLAMTVNTDGVSIGYPKWVTTFVNDLTSGRAGVGETVGTIAGTDLAMTVNTDGVSIGYAKWITTYVNDLTSARAGVGETVGTIAGTDLAMTVNTDGVSVGYPKWITTYVNDLTSARAGVGETVGTVAGTDLAMTVNTDGVSIGYPKWITTFGATFTNRFEPFAMQDGTATMTGSLSQLNLQPFTLPNNLSFGQINFIGIATVVPTSASNSYSGRLTNSSQRHTFGTSYTIGNTNIVDWFLFSRGAGVSTTELQTFASTRNSFATNYLATYQGGATLTNTAGGSLSASQTVSVIISYPFLTSYTSTSVAANSTFTGFSSGYTTWSSAANNNSTFTFSTSAGRTLSIASTYPATAGWSGAKRINMNFATSLTLGEYWLGYLRHSSSSGSSSTNNAFTGAAGTGNSYSLTFDSTAFAATQQLTFAGKTATVVNSLGSLGFVTTANMGIVPGLGSFSGTWASNTTYLNNMANPAGAIALTQILSNVSFFRSWFQMASNMPV